MAVCLSFAVSPQLFPPLIPIPSHPMLLREIRDKGATVAWSPIAREPALLAIATKEGGGAGFDDYGGELTVMRPPSLMRACCGYCPA